MSFVAFQKFWRLAGIDHTHVNGLSNKFCETDESVIASARACLTPMFPPPHAGCEIVPVFSSGQSARQAAGTYRRSALQTSSSPPAGAYWATRRGRPPAFAACSRRGKQPSRAFLLRNLQQTIRSCTQRWKHSPADPPRSESPSCPCSTATTATTSPVPPMCSSSSRSTAYPACFFFTMPTPAQLARFSDCQAIGFAGDARSRTPEWMSAHLPAIFHAHKGPRAGDCSLQGVFHFRLCASPWQHRARVGNWT